MLSRHGLAGGPRPVQAAAPGGGAAAWASVLGELGPLTAAFARHLARRADLLPAEDRSVLGAAAGAVAAVDVDSVLAGLGLEGAGSPLAAVERRATAGDWSGAWYRARHSDGRPLRLFIARPGLARSVDEAFEVLEELLPRLDGRPWSLPAALLADFRAFDVEPRLDLRRAAELFDHLARRADAATWTVAPVVPELVRPGLVALEDAASARGLLTGGALRLRGPQAAQQLAGLFLNLLAEHGVVAGDLDVARWPDGRLLLRGGIFIPQAACFGERVVRFLHAVAGQQPAHVAAAWREEIEASGVGADRVASRLRQATPRRGGAVAATRAAESSADYAVAYWRAAAQAGVELAMPWRAALSTLEALSRRVGRLDPQGDPLAAALLERSWRRSWQELRGLAAPGELSATVERYAAALFEVPPRLERWLDRQEAASAPAAAPAPRRPSGRDRALAVLIALLVVGTTTRVFGDVPTVEAVGTAAFVLLAAAFFRLVLR